MASNAQALHVGNPYERRYAYDKIKRLLAAHGGTLADVVKQVVYVTDVRYQGPVRKCRDEAYGKGPIPANTGDQRAREPDHAPGDRHHRGLAVAAMRGTLQGSQLNPNCFLKALASSGGSRLSRTQRVKLPCIRPLSM